MGMTIRYLPTLFFCLLLALLASRPVVAGEALIRDIVVTNSSTDLLLFLKVDDVFMPEIIDGVQSGLDATIKFEIQISQVRAGWADKEIYNNSIAHTLSYDTLKKVYRLTLVEKGPEQSTYSNLQKAELLMTELNGARLLPLHTMQPDRQYVLKVRAILDQKTPPSFIRYLSPFNRFLSVKTDWYTVQFRF